MAQPTAVTIPNRYSIVPVSFAFTAGTTSPQLVTWMPGDILIVFNAHADTAKTFTIVSNPKYKRGTDTMTTISVPAQGYKVIPRLPVQDDDGQISVTSESTDLKWARLSTKACPFGFSRIKLLQRRRLCCSFHS